MKNGACTKCESKNIYYLDKVADKGYYDTGRDWEIGLNNSFWVGRKGGLVEAYACSDCGYIEFYLKDPKELEGSKLAKKVEA